LILYHTSFSTTVPDPPIHSGVSLFSPTANLFLDTPPEAVFDQFTRLAAKIFGVPVSLISVMDRNRQFFKSALGLPYAVSQARETPLTHSFCLHVVTNDSPIAVPDSRESVFFQDNPSVDELGVAAYAGVPIRDGNGTPFAALCAIDSKPRKWSAAELEILQMLAAQVTREVVLRENLEEMGRNLYAMEKKGGDQGGYCQDRPS
jgi:GAF domain-containing protein